MQNNQIPIAISYDSNTGNVVVQITQLTAFQIPYDVFKNGYYKAKEIKEKAKPIIEMPNGVIADNLKQKG